MHPLVIGLITFACTFGGVVAGIWLSAVLPPHHLDQESKNTIQVGIALIATMTALVLGLVTASAKSSFDAMDAVVKRNAADVLALDRVLARYGPQAVAIREELKRMVEYRIETAWSRGPSQQSRLEPTDAGRTAELLVAQVRALMPQTEEQRSLQSRALDLGESLLTNRWTVVAALGTSIPLPFLSIMLFWLTITFASFGLFAPRNVTVVTVLFLCALSVAGAIFLVLEMDSPFDGLIRVSPQPLNYALDHLNQ